MIEEHMREFPSCQDYRRFARSVASRSRYVFEPHAEDFLQTVIETGASRVDTLEAGSILYRAQLGYELEWHPVDPNDPDGEKFDVPGAFSPARMKPLRDSAREGRVNPKGIPCLYLADDADTAMAETRPWIGLYVSLAQFKIRMSLKIMNLPEPKHYFGHIFLSPPHFREPEAAECQQAVWGEIAYAFSEPVTTSDMTADYAPTQVLAEAFRKAGCDGIRYKSRLGKGYSFALFDLDSADLVNCEIFETKAVTFEFHQAGNPYFVKEHYPEPAE
jgi:hypothetical protein